MPPSKTLERPKRKNARHSIAPLITAYAIIKADIGQNLWQLVTYKIQDDVIISAEKSVENLREILITTVPDLIGGLQ